MPILKFGASKANPAKGINYIMDPEKFIIGGNQGFATNDPKKMARQMLQTMHLFGKGFDSDERKYYHVQIYFDPADLQRNGGILDVGKANFYAADYANEIWPEREVVWAIHDHGPGIHIHFIVASCALDTGRKLNVRNAEYYNWRARVQSLAREYGLSALD